IGIELFYVTHRCFNDQLFIFYLQFIGPFVFHENVIDIPAGVYDEIIFQTAVLLIVPHIDIRIYILIQYRLVGLYIAGPFGWIVANDVIIVTRYHFIGYDRGVSSAAYKLHPVSMRTYGKVRTR